MNKTKIPEGISELALHPPTTNGVVSRMFSSKTMGVDLDLKEMIITLNDQVSQVKWGNLQGAEALLISQALTLNSIFAEMARRAALNMNQNVEATEAYMRMALKAQNQSRSTLETLSNIKSPPLVIAKQANISTGSQQVNNVMQVDLQNQKNSIKPTQLKEVNNELCQDARTPCIESSPNQTLEALGEINRAKVSRG